MKTRNIWVFAALGLFAAAPLATTMTGCASSDQPSSLKGDSGGSGYTGNDNQGNSHAAPYHPRTPGNGGQ